VSNCEDFVKEKEARMNLSRCIAKERRIKKAREEALIHLGYQVD
jgi:hypothetical protein